MAITPFNPSFTSAEQQAIEGLTQLRDYRQSSIPITIPAKRNREQISNRADQRANNSGISNASTCYIEAPRFDEPCSSTPSAVVGEEEQSSLETSFDRITKSESMDNVVDYLKNKFSKFHVDGQEAVEEGNPAVKKQKLKIATDFVNRVPRQATSSIKLPPKYEFKRRPCAVTLFQGEREDNRQLIDVTNGDSSETKLNLATENDTGDQTSNPHSASINPLSTFDVSYDSEPLFNIAVEEASPSVNSNEPSPALSTGYMIASSAMDIDGQPTDNTASDEHNFGDNQHKALTRHVQFQPEPSPDTINSQHHSTFPNKQLKQYRNANSPATVPPTLYRRQRQQQQQQQQQQSAELMPMPITDFMQNIYSTPNLTELKEKVCEQINAVERQVQVTQQHLRQLRRERFTAEVKLEVRQVLNRLEELKHHKDRILEGYHRATVAKAQQHYQQDSHWSIANFNNHSQQENTSTSVSAQQQHPHPYRAMPVTYQHHPFVQRPYPVLRVHPNEHPVTVTTTQQFSASVPISEQQAATVSFSAQQLPPTASESIYRITEERLTSQIYQLGDSSSEEEKEDDDDEIGTSTAHQTLVHNRNGKAGEKKPRWSPGLRSTLFKTIVKHKQLDDMSSFSWSAIGAQVGRSGKSCKDQWRRALFPKLLRVFTEEEEASVEEERYL